MNRLALGLVLMARLCPAAIEFRHGDTAYVVAAPRTDIARHALDALTGYLRAVLGKEPSVAAAVERVPAGQPVIVLCRPDEAPPVPAVPPPGSEEAFAVSSGRASGRELVVLTGATDRGLKRAVHRLIIKSGQNSGALSIPDLKLAEKPWIPEREWAVCPWAPQFVRGAFVNPYADPRMDIWRYSDRQLADYVDMFDWFGFSGVQLLETSYSYSVMGSPEAFQDRQRRLARRAHRNGQSVSLWVWAAEFNGYGWSDPDVVYDPQPGMTAFDDPHVRRGFEKYYDHYAQLAPDVDRLIGHFYDPGRLRSRNDVLQYMRLLERKFRERNPNVRMAIDSWAAGPDYLQALIDGGFKNYLLLEMSMPNLFKPGQRERFHHEAKRLGLDVGVWGWYTTEYETDQLAAMYVNAEVLQNFYRQLRDGAARVHPIKYWSEMEAHHVNNIYSMYAAAQLLWNPDRGTDEILSEIAEAIWGSAQGPKVLDALQLIQEARSGPTWETYWWTLPSHRLGTADPAQVLRRANAVIAKIRNLRPDAHFVPKIPLPFPPAVLVELMLPHLEQIRAFAKFRVELEDLRRAMPSARKDEFARRLTAIWQPIPEYETWIGTFGQIEARTQEILVRKLASEAGVQVTEPAWVRVRDAGRLLEKIQNMQRGRRGALRFEAGAMNEFWWTKEKYADRLDKLVADGSVERIDPQSYRLSNWQHFARQ